MMKIKFLHILTICLTFCAITSYAQNSVAVTVFEDIDGNGIDDAGEPVINGVLVTELRLWQDIDNNGAINAGDVEFMHDGGIGGVYTFGSVTTLPDDNYIIQYEEAGTPGSFYVTKLVNGVGTMDNDNDIDPASNVSGFQLTGGVSETFIDLGLVMSGNIGSFVWEDTNGDGIQDGGELGLDGVNITLLDAMTLAPVVNDIDFLPLANPVATGIGGVGMYTFDNLPPGQYIVEFSLPAPTPNVWFPTMSDIQTDASDVTNDSDAENDSSSPNYLRSHTIILLSDETDEEDKIDAGFFQAAIIGNMVWEDVNGDGIQDPGEPGINGVSVSLINDMGGPAVDPDGLLIPDQITANIAGVDGSYSFDNVPPGDYQVQFGLPAPIGGVDWYPTEFDPGDVEPDDTGLDNDANNDPAAGINYLRTATINVVSNELDEETRIDAGFWLPAKIGNMVFCDINGNGINDAEMGVANIDVRLIDNNTGLTAIDADGTAHPILQTDGAGEYEFLLVPPGEYIVEFAFNSPGGPTTPLYKFTEKNAVGSTMDDDSDVDPNPVSPTFGQTDPFIVISQDITHETQWDAGVYKRIDFLGTLWFDANDDGINTGEGGPGGVLVELFKDGGKIDDVLTSGGGEYEFIDVTPGTGYTIVVNSSAFAVGGGLEGTISCMGSAPADDMVDNDDNGPDTQPGDIISTTFDLLSNCDGNTNILIDYIDFCFEFNCNELNSLASFNCESIVTTLCDVNQLGEFCAILSPNPSGGTQPTPLCTGGGGVANNISWFAFVAYAGSYTITVSPENCTTTPGGFTGVQVGLYTSCDFTETVFCQDDCSIAPVVISSDDLDEGQVYYFFLDGCDGSVCSYQVSIDGTPLEPVLTPTDMCVVQDGLPDCSIDEVNTCPGAIIDFQTQGIELTVDYTWEVNTLLDGPYTGTTPEMTIDENFQATFENVGVYEVCVTNINNGCQNWSGSFCKTIRVAGIDDEEFDPVFWCEEDLAIFDPSILVDADAADPMDPNGDGTLGWQGPTTGFTFGTNTFMVETDEGCMYDQMFDLMMFPTSDVGIVDLTICRDELPLMIDGTQYTELAFPGVLVLDLPDLLLVNSADENGCDSIIDLRIEILDIFNGQLTQGLCTPDGIILNFDYGLESNGFPSTEEDFITWVWTDPSGAVLLDNTQNPSDPLDNIVPQSLGSGTYTLTATVEKNGKSCEFVYTIVIDFEMELPPMPNIVGPPLTICESDSIQTYTAADFGTDAFNWIWEVSPGATILSGGGEFDETIQINWAGNSSGSVTLTIVNGCGTGDPTTIDVTILPQEIPDFTVTPEVCVGSSAVIEFVGDATDINIFTWDFDGGTENSGTGSAGPGPHNVSWTTPGVKTITLSYEDNFGCVSTITTETLNVIAPPDPPMIMCVSQTGEVTFSWDLIPGTTESDYSVMVTTGQSGSISGTTYTITGLGVNEIVDIILTIQTNDACVEITAPGSCVAQDCTPPIVSISAPGDIVEFCLDGTDQSFDLIADIPMGVTGMGTYMGSGIIDTLAGTFNPDSANVGTNSISYVYNTDDGCTATASIVLTVFELPIASFFSNVDTICITDVFNLTYDGTANVNDLIWDYGVDGTGTDGQTPVVTYTSPGEKTIRLTVLKDGCTSESADIPVFVQAELELINVTCSAQAIDSVGFTWNAIPGATGYLVEVMGGATLETTETSYSETGLDPNDEVIITVTVLTDSNCPGSMSSATCVATACPDFTISFNADPPIPDICEGDGSTPITLEATASGGLGGGDFTWSGQNVTDGMFDPTGLTEGSYEIFVIYLENSCQGDSSFMVDIIASPDAAFSVDNTTICVGSTVNILYEGSQLTDQVITWTSGGEDIVAGVDPNDWEATFNDVGTFDIQLDVVNGICTTGSAFETITVEPELVFDPITCVESLDSIVFSWTAVDCATEYEVFIDAISQGTQATTEYVATGLSVGQEVEIEVIAVSGCACGNVMTTMICEAQDCTPVDLSLSTMDGNTEFCFADDLTPIEILVSDEGTLGSAVQTWSGAGVDMDGIFDPVVAGVGTHTITLDYLESVGCPYQATITFIINDNPDVSATFDPITCFDQMTTSLNIMPTGGDGDYTLVLDDNPADLMNDVSAGDYVIMVTDGNGCTDSTSVTITTPSEPVFTIDGSTELLLGDSSTYTIDSTIFTGNTIDSIVWSANGEVICNSPGCFDIGSQTPEVTTVYDVVVNYNNGCMVTATLTVEVTELEVVEIFEIPNIISPNDDGENDVWAIVSNSDSITVSTIRIFDRWGNKVWDYDGGTFVARNNTVSWDGKFNDTALQPGVYVYFIDYFDGIRARVRSGDITIIN